MSQTGKSTTTNWGSATSWEKDGGGAGETPTSSIDCKLLEGSSTASTKKITLAAAGSCRSLDCTGYKGDYDAKNRTLTIGGTTGSEVEREGKKVRLKFDTTMTYTSGGTAATLALKSTLGGGSESWWSGGRTLATLEINDGTTTKLKLEDDLTVETFKHQRGEYNDGGHTTTITSQYVVEGTQQKTFTFTGKWVFTGIGTVALMENTAEKLTLTATSATFEITDTSGSSKEIGPLQSGSANIAVGAVVVPGNNVTVKLASTGSVTITTFTVTGSAASLVLGTGGTTVTTLNLNNAGKETGLRLSQTGTLTLGALSSNGTAESLAKLLSNVGGEKRKIAISGAATISASYVDLKDIEVTSGKLRINSGKDSGGNNRTNGGLIFNENDATSGSLSITGERVEEGTKYKAQDARSGTLSLTGTRADTWGHKDSTSGTATLTGTRADVYGLKDATSGTVGTSGTGTDTLHYSDTRSGTVTTTGARADAHKAHDATSGSATVAGSGVDGPGFHDHTEGVLTLTAEVSDSYEQKSKYEDERSHTIHLIGGRSDVYGGHDVRALVVSITGTGTDLRGGKDARAITITLTGTRADAFASHDLQTLNASLTGARSDKATYHDVRAGVMSLTGTRVGETHGYVDSINGFMVLTGIRHDHFRPGGGLPLRITLADGGKSVGIKLTSEV